MTVPAGWAEFNDATAVFRGRMVAASGTFSGEFASDNVEAVSELNIRDGAVSSYYGFNFPDGSQDISFTLPAQPHAQVIDINAPLRVHASGVGATPSISIYRNDALIKTDYVSLDTSSEKVVTKAGTRWRNGSIRILQVVRFIDEAVNANSPTTYRIVLANDGFQDYYNSGSIGLYFLPSITVGCRKR